MSHLPVASSGLGQRKTSRVRDQRLRQGGLFVPLVFAFAARVEGLPVSEFLSSPTKLVNGLRGVFGHFGADGVACWCDDTTPAAALGCARDWSTYPPGVAALPPPPGAPDPEALGADIGDPSAHGPVAIAVDVVRRMGQLLPDTVLVGTMPGPAALAGQLTGTPPASFAGQDSLRAASKICLTYAKSLCEAGLDILLVRETVLPVARDDLSASDIVRLYSPIWNTARHYGVAAMLAPTDYDSDALAALSGVVEGVIVPAAEAARLEARFKRIGLALPRRLLDSSAADVRAYLDDNGVARAVQTGAFLVTTDGEVPPDVDREALIADVGIVRDRVKEAKSRG